jgi:hypothetical protein
VRKRSAVTVPEHSPTPVVGPGPLGPWRLTIAVGACALTTGRALLDAVSLGTDVDLALGRSFAVAFVVWVLTGVVNKILAEAESRREAESPADVDGSAAAVVHLPGADLDVGARGHAA